MKQHNELQQELLQHVLQYHDSFSSIENLAAAAVGTDSEISDSELRDRLRGSLVGNARSYLQFSEVNSLLRQHFWKKTCLNLTMDILYILRINLLLL